MRKILCLVLSLVMVAFCFAGCNIDFDDDDDEDIIVSLNVDPNIAADLSILVPSGNDNEKTMINCLIDDFALKFPNVNVSLRYVSISAYESNIRQMAAANSLPDIIWSNSPDFYYLVNKKLALNLSPYIRASEDAGVFNMEEDFFTEFFECGTLDGKLYCIPRSCDSVVTFYNTEMFENAGVDMDTVENGWSWDDFLAACAKLRTYFDVSGWSDRYIVDANFTGWLSVNYPMLLSYGAEVVSESGEIKVVGDGTKECLEMVRYMVDHRYVVDSSKSSGSSFENGTSAMLFQSSSFSHYAERRALEGKIDIVSFPLIQDNGTPKIGSGIAGYCINRNAENTDLAWQFLNMILSRDGQEEMALNGLNLASIRKDLSDSKNANWGKKYPNNNFAAYLFGSEYKVDAKFLSRVNLSAKSDISDAVNDMFTYAQDKSRDIDAAIAKCKTDIENALQNAEE